MTRTKILKTNIFINHLEKRKEKYYESIRTQTTITKSKRRE